MPVGVIGIDGLDYFIVKEMIENGDLPNIKSLSYSDEPHKISVTLPHVSACVWTTYTTGVNPGRHGIFDFFKTGSVTDLNNSHDVKVPTLWDIFSNHGLKSLVVNVPLTYPPKSLNGVMVSGVMSPDNRGETYPRDIKQLIQPYVVEPSLDFMYGTGQDISEEIIRVFQLRVDAFLKLLSHKKYDFFFVVFNILDRMSHYFYDMEQCRRSYEIVDKAIGRIVEEWGGWDLIVLSDHGFRPLQSYFFIEEWLKQKGISKVSVSRSLIPESLIPIITKFKDIMPKNRVLQREVFHKYFRKRVKYAQDSPVSYYSTSGHYLICNISEKERIKTFLRDCKFLQVVVDAEDIFKGTHIDPRMVFVIGSEGYEAIQGFGKVTIPSEEYRFFASRGTHRWEGAVIMSNINTIPTRDICVAPHVARLLGVSHDGFDRGGDIW